MAATLRQVLTCLTVTVCGFHLVGCGGTNVPPADTTPTVEVTGTVKLNGSPFKGTGYVLAILPTSGGSATMTPISNDGKFMVSAPTGPAVVAVVSPEKFTEMHGSTEISADNQQSVTIAAGQAIDVNLTKAPPPLPKVAKPLSSHDQ